MTRQFSTRMLCRRARRTRALNRYIAEAARLVQTAPTFPVALRTCATACHRVLREFARMQESLFLIIRQLVVKRCNVRMQPLRINGRACVASKKLEGNGYARTARTTI
eukprot:5668076-Pyramimonas_sp.AAC.1